ncbi:MAG TPA: hypothetical protein VN742_08015, partial [Candidatus Binataceae bacterium]|nr:hypothetical protein [Candidatus Binataceae bacterium]
MTTLAAADRAAALAISSARACDSPTAWDDARGNRLNGGGMSVADLMIGTGPVVQLVLVTLAGFSVGSWGIILYKLVQIS